MQAQPTPSTATLAKRQHLAAIERQFRAACLKEARYHLEGRTGRAAQWVRQAREHHGAVMRLTRTAKGGAAPVN